MFKNKKPVVAIDGTACSGKGTLARKIAKVIDFDHLDTGILYRYLAFLCIKNSTEYENINQLFKQKIDLNHVKTLNLRTDEISKKASIIASKKEVREFLLNFQRNFSNFPPNGRGSVIDGRDIGSIVTPNAEVKFFIDAKVNIRACRRLSDLKSLTLKTLPSLEVICSQLEERDDRDMNRASSPLIRVKDAIFIDTTNISPDATLNKALKTIKKILINKTN